MNTILRYLLYAVAIIVYYEVAKRLGANLNNWFVAFSIGVSAYALFGWVLPSTKSDKSTANIGLASSVYQTVGFARREAAARRRKVQ